VCVREKESVYAFFCAYVRVCVICNAESPSAPSTTMTPSTAKSVCRYARVTQRDSVCARGREGVCVCVCVRVCACVWYS